VVVAVVVDHDRIGPPPLSVNLMESNNRIDSWAIGGLMDQFPVCFPAVLGQPRSDAWSNRA